jgi:hypothetical protein
MDETSNEVEKQEEFPPWSNRAVMPGPGWITSREYQREWMAEHQPVAIKYTPAIEAKTSSENLFMQAPDAEINPWRK